MTEFIATEKSKLSCNDNLATQVPCSSVDPTKKDSRRLETVLSCCVVKSSELIFCRIAIDMARTQVKVPS